MATASSNVVTSSLPESTFRRRLRTVSHAVLIALAFVVTFVASTAIAPLLGLASPATPAGSSPGAVVALLVFGVAIQVGLTLPLAQTVALRRRWLAFGAWFYVLHGVGTAMEGALFTSTGAVQSAGGLGFLLFAYLAPWLVTGALISRWFPTSEGAVAVTPARLSPLRLLVAWLAFPIIYLAIGRLIAPWVLPYYQAGAAELVAPPLTKIVAFQLVRSALILAATLPLLRGWTGDRRSFVIAYAGPFAWLTGLLNVLQGYWLPGPVRLIHSGELIVDAVLYAFVLAWLYLPPAPEGAQSTSR